MANPEKRHQLLALLSSQDSEILLRSGVAPGRLGTAKGAPYFLASSRPRVELRAEAVARRSHEAYDPCLDSAVQLVRQPMFMIDAERKVRLRNAKAAQLLTAGNLLVDKRGTLSCRDPDSDRRLDVAIDRLATAAASPELASQERRAVWLRRSDGGGAAATLHLLHDCAECSASMLLTIFEPGEAPSVDHELIAMAYGLTSAEARLAAMLASGKSTADCVRDLRVKTSTLRSHLSAIYRKTGAGGQADLVRLVLSLCVV